MSLEDMELNVGGTSVKGVWIAILLSFASTIGGGIWAASEFFSRLEMLEDTVQESLANSETTNARFDDFRDNWIAEKKEFSNTLAVMEQQLEDNDIANLQAKLAELGTNLKSIMEAQQDLLELRDQVVELDKTVTANDMIVSEARNKFDFYDNRMERFQKDLDDAWKAMDAISNPLQ